MLVLKHNAYSVLDNLLINGISIKCFLGSQECK